ncbi:Gfo/Idh/MocA family protein [Noviherbaspirillum denitrificans]|uniref:Oxidoreductase n=1 Tax=Noviherbaspirillum denitrificans TaxID=1968433 RepID=A0A254TC00_9BURK|nr:Gfo/Idh/MocA family oxidoreductase [Noviherbaspirillum denitrificans]OWW20186.1 oxidoreductase [Noviherbaspirillum denitrificans]
MNTLRIAVAGAGLIGKRHMQLIRDNSRTTLCALIDPVPAARATADAEGVPLFPSLEEFFASSVKADGMILATPNGLHVSGALTCLAHRMPALVEKPVADTLDAAEALEAAEARCDVPLLVGHHRRHSATLAAVREEIASGRLGRVVSFTGTALFHKPDSYYEAGPWRTVAGGGPILINLIHEIDAVRYMLGEIVAVQAMASNAVRGFAVEDTAAVLLHFASGALGTFMLSDTSAAPRSWEQTSGEDKSYPAHPEEDCYFIAGTNGSLAVPTMRTWNYDGERSWWKPFARTGLARGTADPMARQLDHFCDVIRGQAAPRCTVHDATQSLRVTLAVAQAAASKGVVMPAIPVLEHEAA